MLYKIIEIHFNISTESFDDEPNLNADLLSKSYS